MARATTRSFAGCARKTMRERLPSIAFGVLAALVLGVGLYLGMVGARDDIEWLGTPAFACLVVALLLSLRSWNLKP